MIGGQLGLADRLRPIGLRFGIGLALVASAIAIYLLITLERSELVEATNSYDNYWVGHQLQAELQQLIVEVVRAEHGDPGATFETVQLRLDVLVGRRTMAIEGALGNDFAGVPEFSEAMTKLGAALNEADAAMATRGSASLSEVAARIRRALTPIEAPVRDLRPAIRTFYAESNDRVQRRLTSYLTAIVGLLALSAAGVLLFVLLYARQHRRLRESEETFRAAFDRAGAGIAHLSSGGRWLRVNATLCRLAGREADELLKCDIRVLLPELGPFADLIAPLVNGERAVLDIERNYHGGEGTHRHAAFTFSLVHKPSGAVDYVILVMEDVSERRSIEAQLHQAQKMEAVGQLTGGVAHDFNNLLGIIVGNLGMLEPHLPSHVEARHHLACALAAAERGATLTRRLLAFSRRQTLLPEATDVRRLVQEVITLLKPILGETIDVRAQMSVAPLFAMVDQSQLETALLNLAINARDAMANGGTLVIATASLERKGGEASEDLGPGRYVVISVMDTGTGMSAEVAERAFEPFFTTKDIGKGSGLGLSMVYGFVKQSGGHVRIDSAPGRGTTVRLYLPALMAPALNLPDEVR